MKALVAYYSWSGNTKRVAQVLHELVGGDIFEIQPERSYPRAYNETAEIARREIRSGFRPPLKTYLDSIDQYDVIFLGSPNWWGSVAPPVLSFLLRYDFQGKVLAPFFTHSGGGSQMMAETVRKLSRGAIVLPELAVSGDGGAKLRDLLMNWLEQIKGRG